MPATRSSSVRSVLKTLWLHSPPTPTFRKAYIFLSIVSLATYVVSRLYTVVAVFYFLSFVHVLLFRIKCFGCFPILNVWSPCVSSTCACIRPPFEFNASAIYLLLACIIQCFGCYPFSYVWSMRVYLPLVHVSGHLLNSMLRPFSFIIIITFRVTVTP